MEDSLEARLKSHAKAFDGLLSLLPAKIYYGQDNSDQWQRKKQTKEEARRAKKAKLDPESSKSAKDVIDENERKRKRQENEESEIEGIEREIPLKDLKKSGPTKPKKQKLKTGSTAAAKDAAEAVEDGPLPPKKTTAEKRSEKRQRQRAKAEKVAAKKQKKAEEKPEIPEPFLISEADNRSNPDMDMTPLDVDGLQEDEDINSPTSASAPHSPIFDSFTQASVSSTSSAPPVEIPKPKIPAVESAELRARLMARIEALRTARRADGPDGTPARNRQELMDARRRKEEQRKAHKKQLRLKAREEERIAKEAALAIQNSSASGSNGDALIPRPKHPENNFSFGRIAFSDGQQLDSELSTLLDTRKRKGPQDPLTALQALENKRARISGLDAEKRKDIEEKDRWLNAKKRAHGVVIRDEASLLKKTLKRREQLKRKSEKEWTERIDGVEKGKQMRQKKREDNLRKRKEEKGVKGKKKGGKGGKGGAKKKSKARPGFEGTFTAKVGQKRK
ncbi:MAG: surfeit locus protein [Trizodia sp. TS-e1964]|nr:MAG: surfeit locus protein [Trizodia sp. TS-e1964]